MYTASFISDLADERVTLYHDLDSPHGKAAVVVETRQDGVHFNEDHRSYYWLNVAATKRFLDLCADHIACYGAETVHRV